MAAGLFWVGSYQSFAQDSQPLPENAALVGNSDGTFTLKIGEQAVTNVSYLYTGRTNGVGALNTTYAFMTYSNSQAPTTPGFYTVTATASGGYSGTLSTNFGKPGLLWRTLETGRTLGTSTNNLLRSTLFSGLQCITTNLTLTNGSTNATFLTFTNGLSYLTNGDTFPNTITLFTATTLRLFPAYSNSIFDTFTLTVAPAAHAGDTNPMVFPVLVTATNSAGSSGSLLSLSKLDPIVGDTNYVQATCVSRPNIAIQIEFRQTLNEPWRPLQDFSLPVTGDHQNLTRTNANNQVEALPMATITPAAGVSRLTVPAGGVILRVWQGTLSGLNTFAPRLNATSGTVSSATTFATATNLTTNVTVTAPAGFELATSSGGGYTNSVTLPSGTASNTLVYVRLAATNEPRNLLWGAMSLPSQSVIVQGTVTANAAPASPAISVAGALAAVHTTYGTASASPTSFTVSGTDLTGNLTVTPPAGYEVSTTAGSGYGGTVTLTQSGGTVASTTVYVRLAAATVPGSYSGAVTVSGGGATSQTVATVASTVAVRPLSDGDITLTRSGDSFSASAAGVSGFTMSYGGRTTNGVATSYGPAGTAPTAAGYYTVTATSSDARSSGSKSENYFVAGPIAANDAVTRPAGNSSFSIPQATLLQNDKRIDTNGIVQTSSLAVTAASGATVNGVMADFTSAGAGAETFTYTVTDSTTSKTATATVTVTPLASLANESISIIHGTVGTAVYLADYDYTQITLTFTGTPYVTYNLQYTGTLGGVWKEGGGFYSEDGTFQATLREDGDHAADWNNGMYFRAYR